MSDKWRTPQHRAYAPPASAVVDVRGGVAPASVGSPPPLAYRISAGDVISIAFFKQPSTADGAPYRVQTGDVLGVHVAGHAELEADLIVRPDGQVSFFQIGDFAARGKTVEDVRSGLQDALQKVIPAAEVSVFLRNGSEAIDQFLELLSSDLNSGSARSVRVKEDGLVNFPLVGPVQVGGRSVVELSQELEGLYEEALTGDLSISVNLVSAGTGNLAVLGEVKQPGLFTLYGPMHPLEVMAMAGGLQETADIKRLVVVRRDASGRAWHLRPCDPRYQDPAVPGLIEPHDIVILPKSTIANVDQFVDQYIRQALPVRLSLGAFYRLDD